MVKVIISKDILLKKEGVIAVFASAQTHKKMATLIKQAKKKGIILTKQQIAKLVIDANIDEVVIK